jgi:hypothetical protein
MVGTVEIPSEGMEEQVQEHDQAVSRAVSNPLILPDSRPKVQKNVVRLGNLDWVPIYCANCGCDGGLVPAEHCNFAFYLCVPCADKWEPLAGTFMVPDEVFWQKVHDEQMEKYGRILSPDELVEVLKDPENSLTKLCKDRQDFNSVKMT